MKSKAEFLNQLENHKGLITLACTNANVSRSTYYRWYNEDEDFKHKVDQVMQMQIDYVEEKLLNLISEGNPSAIIFYLKTKGKQRGYTEKQELSIETDKNIELKIV